MVYDRGKSHSSPSFSYSGKNYHREKTPEEKEQEYQQQKQREQQRELEQEVKTSSKILPPSAQELVQQGVVKETTLWREFLQTLGNHFDTEIVAIIATTTVDGVLPFGDIVAAGVALSIAIEIYQNWNYLWAEATSQIVTTSEPKNQVYETPTDEQVDAMLKGILVMHLRK
jgi:polyphosphate kinase